MVSSAFPGPTAGAFLVAVLAVGLTGCAGTGTGAGSTGGGEDTPGGGSPLVVSGTGSYVIGEDIPYGGFQLHGEPDEQPAGCTWSILDADGGISFHDQGSYVFLTDVPEAVTFVTAGCPDWEQFE
jgi:hypothetical protein